MFEAAEDIKTHLEYLGYEVTLHDGALTARHQRNLNISMKPYADGLLVTSIFGLSESGKANRLGLYKLVNELNATAAASRFYVDQDDDLLVEGYFPGAYDRARFATFIDVYNASLSHMTRIDNLGDFVA